LKKAGGVANGRQDVMEGLGEVDGDHQALFRLPSYRCQPAADGSIWGKAIDR